MKDQIQIHEDASPGLTMEGVVFEHRENHGRPCCIATAQIGTIFGAEVHGEIKGIGKTQEQALERLQEERKKLYESLWI